MKAVEFKGISFYDAKGASVGEFSFTVGLNFFWGENGSGKTAIFKGFLFTLGVNIELPDIYKDIAKISLTFFKDGKSVLVHRFVSKSLFICERDGVEKTFHNEKDLSLWLLDLFDLPKPSLTQKFSKDPAVLYFSILLPYLGIDQDHGWSQCYYNFGRPEFILGQSEESIRGLSLLPPKYPFELNQEIKNLENDLKQMKRQRTIAKENSKALETKVKNVIGKGVDRLEGEVTEIKNSLNEFKNGIVNANLALKPYEIKLRNVENRLQQIYETKSKYRREADLYKRLIQGIDDELVLLNDNDTSIEVIRGFCSSVAQGNCGLFANSKDSYAKRLYFLKDQAKDFVSVMTGLEQKIKDFEDEELSLNHELKKLNSEKKLAFEAGVGGEKTFEAITELSKNLIDSENLLMLLHRYNKSSADVEELTKKIETSSILLDQKEAQVKGYDSTAFERFVSDFSTHLNSWIEVLDVKNVNLPVTVNKEFKIVFSDKKIFDQSSNQSGSTRARIVLAYTAALLETMTDKNSSGVRFVWLDTPRQHELKMKDLSLFYTKLGELAKKRGLTIVSGVTDLPVDEKGANSIKPSAIVKEKPYFLKLER